MVGAIRSERWAASDRNRWAAYVRIRNKLGIAVWDYLGSRLKMAGHIVVQPLDRYVRGRFRPA
jgi:hypothetical protein